MAERNIDKPATSQPIPQPADSEYYRQIRALDTPDKTALWFMVALALTLAFAAAALFLNTLWLFVPAGLSAIWMLYLFVRWRRASS